METPGLDRGGEEQRHEALVDDLVARGELRTPAIVAAFREVPRHLFVPRALVDDAYHDHPLPIGAGQTISQPTVIALMTEALELRPTDRVLEIGTGSGYQAAILSRLVSQVFTVEVVPELGTAAARRLAGLGYANVEVRVGDGYQGWPQRAPFDRVIVTAAPQRVPAALVEQLAPGGILVAPIGAYYYQRLVRLRRTPLGVEEDFLADVVFVPMVHGVQ